MSYYGEWKMFKRELAEELAKPKPDEKKIEELKIEIKSAEWMMQHYEQEVEK